ncbi:hypothetical protein BKA81DRAFT_41095 [Phyllosticta paracitricarpa]|uniref:Transmembrane protein n=1 Tax=Phyllosticta paracitricarpa TaxID=2016321 RepID=A0ABR1NHJ6_9PEZI
MSISPLPVARRTRCYGCMGWRSFDRLCRKLPFWGNRVLLCFAGFFILPTFLCCFPVSLPPLLSGEKLRALNAVKREERMRFSELRYHYFTSFVKDLLLFTYYVSLRGRLLFLLASVVTVSGATRATGWGINHQTCLRDETRRDETRQMARWDTDQIRLFSQTRNKVRMRTETGLR